jgi:thiol:disulfide interchange protein DsbC
MLLCLYFTRTQQQRHRKENHMNRILALLLSAMTALPCMAGENEVAQSFQQQMNVKPDSVVKSPMEGIYEVYAGGQYFYTNEQVSHFVSGNLFSVAGQKNLTAEKKFTSLPLELAIKQVRGNGKNVLVSFEDPNCPYCKKLAKELSNMTDITIYTFVTPVLGRDSEVKSRDILCAANSGKAWQDWALKDAVPPAADANCDASVTLNKTRTVFQKLGARGTPYMMFADGQVSSGYIPATEIAKRFAAMTR